MIDEKLKQIEKLVGEIREMIDKPTPQLEPGLMTEDIFFTHPSTWDKGHTVEAVVNNAPLVKGEWYEVISCTFVSKADGIHDMYAVRVKCHLTYMTCTFDSSNFKHVCPF